MSGEFRPSAKSVLFLKEALLKQKSQLEENKKYLRKPTDAEQTETYLEDRAIRWFTEDNLNFNEEKVYLYLNSGDRDLNSWATPAEYVIDLPSEVTNIIKVDLIQASLPTTARNVTANNQIIRFSVTPHTTIKTVRIPIGCYTGATLALELMIQMNMALYSTDILAGTYILDSSTGYLTNPDGSTASIDQIKVSWLVHRKRIVFQYVDSARLPSSDDLTLYWDFTDDLSAVLGFEQDVVQVYGSSVLTYYALNTNTDYSTIFGPSISTDTRTTLSLHGNKACDLKGDNVILLSIAPFNDNDMVASRGIAEQSGCFGVLNVKWDYNAAIIEVNNNNYPIQKYFREGISRAKRIHVRFTNLRGQLVDFDGENNFLTLKITTKRTQPEKSIFTR